MDLTPTHQINIEVNTNADYPVPEFLKAIDEVYTFFEMHVATHMEELLIDSLKMYAKHRGADFFR